ncbi:DUF2272 domain-containing protein [Methylobacterium sp. Gmos1]
MNDFTRPASKIEIQGLTSPRPAPCAIRQPSLAAASKNVSIVFRIGAAFLPTTGLPMAADLTQLLDAADHEWKHWGQSTWHLKKKKRKIGHTDDEEDYANYIINKYCSIVKDMPSLTEIQDDQYFWSAVGISAFFHAAGFSKQKFPFSNNHSVWIRKFIAARQSGSDALYHGFRLTEPEASPDVGDLIGYIYDKVSFEGAQKYFDKKKRYSSHTDLVVARRANEIDVIGANVMDSVTKKTISLDGNGHIADRTHRWFVVLKKKDF